MPFWKRQYRVNFPDLGFSFEDSVKIEFRVERDIGREVNKCEIKLYNLSLETREKIQKNDVRVELFAGYEGNGGLMKLFSGDTVQTYTQRQDMDEMTSLTLADGFLAVRDSWFAISLPPGTSAGAVLGVIASNMGLPLEYGDGVALGSFANGYSFAGQGSAALDEVCGAQGCTWSIQNGILQIIMNGGIAANRGFVFSAESGLIGSPERVVDSNPYEDLENEKRKKEKHEKTDKGEQKAGWRIKTLLSPTITPGDAVKLEAKQVVGWFRVQKIEHDGDSEGDEWHSSMDLVEGLGELAKKTDDQ